MMELGQTHTKASSHHNSWIPRTSVIKQSVTEYHKYNICLPWSQFPKAKILLASHMVVDTVLHVNGRRIYIELVGTDISSSTIDSEFALIQTSN